MCLVLRLVYAKLEVFYYVLAELRRPEGQPSGAPYSYKKEKETH